MQEKRKKKEKKKAQKLYQRCIITRAQERSTAGRWSWDLIAGRIVLQRVVFLNSRFSDIVFVTLLRRGVETAIS